VTTFAFPAITPNSSAWGIESNTAAFVSSITGAIQTKDRGGERWRAMLTFTNLNAANKAVMRAFLARLNGQQHRFTLQDHAVIQRGAFGGTPLVNGAGQTGVALNIDGASNNITNWIRAGDMFGAGGDLKMAVLDADSDGSGLVALTFVPRILTAPSNGSAIVISAPTGTFMLANNAVTWGNRPGDFTNFSLDCVEDILA
jgi:hypothetical protein